MPKGDCLLILRDHSHVVECVAFAPASLIPIPSMAAAASGEASADADGKEAAKGEIKGIKGIIASGSRDKQIKLWDLATGKCVATYVRFVAYFVHCANCCARLDMTTGSEDCGFILAENSL